MNRHSILYNNSVCVCLTQMVSFEFSCLDLIDLFTDAMHHFLHLKVHLLQIKILNHLGQNW